MEPESPNSFRPRLPTQAQQRGDGPTACGQLAISWNASSPFQPLNPSQDGWEGSGLNIDHWEALPRDRSQRPWRARLAASPSGPVTPQFLHFLCTARLRSLRLSFHWKGARFPHPNGQGCPAPSRTSPSQRWSRHPTLPPLSPQHLVWPLLERGKVMPGRGQGLESGLKPQPASCPSGW